MVDDPQTVFSDAETDAIVLTFYGQQRDGAAQHLLKRVIDWLDNERDAGGMNWRLISLHGIPGRGIAETGIAVTLINLPEEVAEEKET